MELHDLPDEVINDLYHMATALNHLTGDDSRFTPIADTYRAEGMRRERLAAEEQRKLDELLSGTVTPIRDYLRVREAHQPVVPA